jgi:hypothetical protein
MEVIAMLKHCRLAQLLLLNCFILSGSNIFAMYSEAILRSLQKTSLIGRSVFTSNDLPCLIAFTKLSQNDFFLLINLAGGRESDIFSFGKSLEDVPHHGLLDMLFPEKNRKFFIFRPDRLKTYLNLINMANDNYLLAWWKKNKTYTEQYYTHKNIKTGADVKLFLQTKLTDFTNEIRKITAKINVHGKPLDLLTEIALTTEYLKSSDAKTVENNIKLALFDNFKLLKTGPLSLNDNQVDDLKKLIESVMTAQFCYQVNLAEIDTPTLFPRALYQAFETFGRSLGVTMPSLNLYYFSSKFGKKLLGGAAAVGVLGTGVALFSKRSVK